MSELARSPVTAAGVGLGHLFARVALVEARVRAMVEHRRRDDPAPDDPFRGLYLTDDDVDRLLAARAPGPPRDDAALREVEQACTAAGTPSRLRELQRACGLSDLDVEILLAALVPDLDARFERLYGYLNDDVTRRRATIGLALEIGAARPTAAAARRRLTAEAPLLQHLLVTVEDPERPFLSRGLRVPDRVTAHLLGGDDPDAVLTDLLTDITPAPGSLADDLGRVLTGGVRLVYLRDHGRRTGTAVAAAALHAADRGILGLDLQRLASRPAPEELVRVAGREALLRGCGIVAEPVEALTEGAADALRRLASVPVPVLLAGDVSWDPAWSREVPLTAESPRLAPTDRERLWTTALGDATSVPLHLHLGPGQIGRAVRWAQLTATLDERPVDRGLLQAGARAQNAAGLERLSRRVEPAVGWTDLVLTDAVSVQLRELAARARHREKVLTEWRMRPGGGRGIGVAALFAGDSGTGKTMSAEVIAGELGLDLYRVDLATVVDKYVGETEKNLEKIFTQAAGVNGVLLFDEADAVFGKRSEVRDAHDRYANIESAYLLQRMETFDGLAILSTNLRANIDEAFTRRLDCIIDFPTPTEELRLQLWSNCLAPPLPLGDDLDLSFCAAAFELTGGNIRSAATTAAYLAAAADRPVGMAELITAVEQEYRKLGRLVLEREFGRYLALLR
ncbi:MAG TPA: ATP-binding protein [Pseudonocardia sp.]|nr:ATP-binding protein [Pseudonocardia sp.]